MNRKMIVGIAGLLLLVSAVAVQAGPVAGPSQGARSSEVIELGATDLGRAEYEAAGFAKKVVTGLIEEFAIRVVAKCPDGTLFIVRVSDGTGNEFDLGTVEMLFDSGSMTMRNTTRPLPFPLSAIQGVAVNEARGPILKGEFAE